MAAKKTKTSRTTTSAKSSKTSKRTVPSAKSPIASPKEPSVQKPGMKVKRSYIITLLAVVLLAALLIALRGLFIAAMVNNQPISRISVISELEKQGGQQALNSLITKTLIKQEAQKQNVTVSEEEINTQLKEIEGNLKEQGQTLDQVLSMQGMSRDDLLEQVELQKTIEKMVGKDIKVSDEEITKYLEENQDFIPAETKPEDAKKQAEDQLYQQKLNEKVRPWLDKLQKDAKIFYFVNY